MQRYTIQDTYIRRMKQTEADTKHDTVICVACGIIFAALTIAFII